ncbi:Uncharacterised protein [Starkeya nomas]|uniref:Uncharacterized protein n=2 Tax=Xanthobacteraceae TaxID=335928 RepID=A0A5S9NPG6_9HYPH|nr:MULTISPECIES: hypothetical protein [Xanthobacteraceae]TSJ61447.1 hypothetical protein FO470_13225 [Ancylobacter moscoviensis]CAA0092277.1 Uncharacterised protein [Starkeya nomas]
MLDRLLQYDHMTLLAGAVAGAVALIILLRWVGQRVVVPKTRLALVGDGSFDYDIAGTDGHQPVLARIAGRTPSSLGEECIAELLTAVTKAGEVEAIVVHVEGARVGEIPARDLLHFHAAAKGRPARCEAVVLRGHAEDLRVRLDVAWPPRLS